MAVEKWTPERRRALTRSALIDAAAQVFARRGFEGASLDEIAATAGYTRGAIYKNFEGKEDLFFAVFDQTIERNIAAFGDQFEDDETIELDVGRIAEIWQHLLARDPEEFAFHLEFRLYAIRNPEVRERFIAHQRRQREILTEFIEQQARRSGIEMRMPADMLAALGEVTSWGCLEAMLLNPEDSKLFEKVIEMMIAVSVGPRE